MILTIITFIIMLSVLVVVHEYGHFLFARLCGIKIKEFSIGFGPKLFTWLKKNDTDFNVRAYPLGGFVSMAGESLDEMDDKYGFQAQPAWKRFLVIFAGPLFSFIFAVLIFISIGFFFGFPTGENSNKIQMVLPQSKASEIGLRSGDEIFAVNGIKSVNGSYIDIIHNSVGKELTLTVKRNNKTLTFNAAPDLMLRFLGVNTKVSPNHNGVIFDSVSRETILYKKGVSNNDILISVNGIDVNSTVELKNVLDNIHTEKLSLVVESGHNLKTINVKYTPFYYELGDFKLFFPERYFLSDKDNVSLYGLKSEDKLLKINGNEIFTDKGFLKYSNDTIKSITVERNEKNINLKINKKLNFIPVYYTAAGAFGFYPAPKLEKTNIKDSVKIGTLYIGKLLSELFKVMTSREIKDNVGGPIAIASATNSAVNTGFFSIVLLTGGLSLSLAVLNLLPIPVLDGGHIFIMFLEWIRRKRFTKEQLGIIQVIGLLIIILIFVAVMYSDITKLWMGTLPK